MPSPRLRLSIHAARRGHPPAIWQEAVSGAYEKKGAILMVSPEGFLHTVDPVTGQAWWSGGLRATARTAFEVCAPGEVFRYRNRPLRRLPTAEVRALLARWTVWSLGGALVDDHRMPAAPLPAPTVDTLVYGPNALARATLRPMGTAGALGLVKAVAVTRSR